MRNKIKTAAAILSAALVLSGTTAFAQSSEAAKPTATPTPTAQTETVLEDNRTLTPKGNAQLVDDVSDSEDLQFITVTARDGNVFYFVIDKGAGSDNVYFLNTVDESDLAALIGDDTGKEAKPETETQVSPSAEPTGTAAESQTPEAKQEQEKEPEQKKSGNNAFLLILLALIAAGAIGLYYFKVLLPKKKLEQADDIEDFEFEESETDEPQDEDAEDDTEPDTDDEKEI